MKRTLGTGMPSCLAFTDHCGEFSRSAVDHCGQKNVTFSNRKKAADYMTIEYNEIKYQAFPDSGYDVSVQGRRILPGEQYTTCKKNLLTANASTISILGSTVVAFRVAGVSLEHQFLIID
jgi:hypothetical protein